MANGNAGDPEVPGVPNQPNSANAGDPEVPGQDNDTMAFAEQEAVAGDPEVPGSAE
jgi:hypothetical protein